MGCRRGSNKGSLAEKVQGLVGFNSLLNKVAVAESYEEAVVLTAGLGAGGSVVTREGAWLGPNWVKSSGEPSNQQGYVERAAEISALKAEIEELVEAVEGFSRTKAHAKSELASITEQRRTLDLKDKQIRAAVSKLESEVSVQKVRVEQFQLRLDTNKKDSSELARLIDDEKEELVLHRDEWQEAMLNLEMIDSKRVEHSLKQSEMHEVTEAKRVALRDAQSQAHSLAMQIQQVSSRIEMLRQSLEQTSSSMESAQLRLELADSDSSESETVEEISEHLQQELASHLREEEKLSEARAGQDEVLTILREDETRREQIEAKLLESRSVLESLRMKLQAVAMEQMQDLEAIANDEFDLEVLLECAKQDGSNSQGLIAELERLATKVQRLGPINLAAIDEYSVQSERKQYLDEQDAELQEALEVLASAIRKIDKETRARFKETYEQVNAGLQALFPKIFGGGSASLELTDSDLLETGVAIIARPPGKNNSTIHLLSGGEKALTALALIFSIFKLNPAPFCMLDEVDAPLDDANVGRFANLVKEMSSTVQFIYISHNKVSMEMADQLLGVTMHEPGVSRLVSVNVEEAAQMVEA